MAKKAKASAASSSKTRLEARVDEELANEFRDVAESAGISVNQLLQGLVAWATENAVQGCPVYDKNGLEVSVEERPGCLFFGKASDREQIMKTQSDEGTVHFVLDLSLKNAIRNS
ncbi:hypothetical protein SAMN06265222_12283 [Neorhodopirellula lusitana]|uniref:Uncharacterized protein n=1 Tax=Neorhodopirellula lusitana TaxID=445327 RepID=A0ABY1QQ79_9BACT|nr:hypothetical protein [Neorhodopirellula lusitana]SMP77066.1 hypothetical protein SAMN06265222_12283 [Neorhodopirellula lusitana]